VSVISKGGYGPLVGSKPMRLGADGESCDVFGQRPKAVLQAAFGPRLKKARLFA
jgi:hypothetical protein